MTDPQGEEEGKGKGRLQVNEDGADREIDKPKTTKMNKGSREVVSVARGLGS